MSAYEADYVTRDGRLVIDEPAVRARLVKALDGYTAIYRKGCTPPDAVDWDDSGNNKAFLAQAVVMTPNPTLSIPGALRATRPEDYYQERGHDRVAERRPRPAARHPRPVTSRPRSSRPAGTSRPRRSSCASWSSEGWLAHWLDFAGDRFLPPMPALLDAAVLARPGRPAPEVGGKAIHRVVADGLSPEQAADEAIARVKQILSE